MLLETDLKGMFILQQVSKETIFSLLSDVTQVTWIFYRKWLGQKHLPCNQNLLESHSEAFKNITV